MARFITLTDHISVAVDEIVEIEVRNASGYLDVRLSNGRIVSTYPDYNATLWQTRDRLVKAINSNNITWSKHSA
jgi:hypothetical protein